MTPAYGWRRQRPDKRDLRLAMPTGAIPASSDNGALIPRVFGQGNIGSCVANVVALQVMIARAAAGFAPFTPSRLWLYFEGRAVERSQAMDVGMEPRDAYRVLTAMGICAEDLPAKPGRWLYNPSMFSVAPTQDTIFAAAHHRAGAYHAVPAGLDPLRATLAGGLTVAAGISCFESFESERVLATGEVVLPGADEGYLGGHDILLYGHDDARRVFLWQNSWGVNYGKGGRGTIPYDYIADPDLASDFWVLTRMMA